MDVLINKKDSYINLTNAPEETDRIVIKFVRETNSSIDILEERTYHLNEKEKGMSSKW
jgi:hypothetical protein